MNRCLIYARVSTEDQVDRYGLPAQLRACREYAVKHGYSIIDQISEDYTGVVLDRPGLNRVRDMVRAGSVDVLVSLDADRLSRELAHLLVIKPEIEKRARIEFVTGSFEDTPSGRMFFNIRGSIAQYERELIRDRTMRGKKEKAREGLYIGGRLPYGYTIKDERYAIDAERSEVVRRIFAEYNAGRSIRGITAMLREDGVPTWGGRHWGHSSVARILVNETYCGTAYFGTHKREGSKLKLRVGAERIKVEVPAIIPRPVWLRAQERLSGNRSSGRPTSRYLLRGLLWCSCGRKMGGDPGKGSRCYRCYGRDRLRVAGELCRQSVQAAAIDRTVWSSVTEVFSDATALRRLVAEHYSELRGEAGKVEPLRKQIAVLRQREARAISTMLELDDEHARSLLKQKYQAARDERRRLESELSRIDRRPNLSVDADITAIAESIRGVIPTLDPDERQEFVRRSVDRIVWDGVEATIFCFFGTELSTTSARYRQFSDERITFKIKAKVAA